jgi:mannosyltransferase OCH1-like enzyme
VIGRPGPITRGETFDPIPRVIHQTWKTEDVPAAWKDFQQSWRDAHPGWAYKLWTDADNRRLIAERYVWFLSTYDAFPREIQRVDAAKYFILHSEGSACSRSIRSPRAAG